MRRLALSTAALVLLSSGSAEAATLVNAGGTLTFSGGAEANRVTFTAGNGSVIVSRFPFADLDGITAAGCRDLGGTGQNFECDGANAVVIDSGPGDDQITAAGVGVPMAISGGPGNDQLGGGAAADVLSGGPGDDVLSIGPADTISGGDGIDTALDEDPGPASLSIDGLANDGGAVATANIQLDVEDLLSTGPVAIEGGGPPRGPVTLIGSTGANRLTGAESADVIVGGGGADTLIGYAGDDVFDARDGAPDRIECGPGADVVLADPLDAVGDSCENVQVKPAAFELDDRPPTLEWKTPRSAARIGALAGTRLEVGAADDAGVKNVRFLDDDRALCTATAAPYRCAYKPRPQDVGRNLLVAIVTDSSGQTTTLTRPVTVMKYVPSRVSLRVARRGSRYVASGKVTLPKGPRCAGTVTLTAGKERARIVKLHADCTYRTTVTVPGKRKPRFVARFDGTATVAAKRSAAA